MNRTRVLPVVLEVLDDGFRLYRRNLAGFTLVATAVLVMVAVLAMSFMAFVRAEIGTSSGWLFLAWSVLLLLGYPLVLYAFAALSRATMSALDDQPITLPAALRLNPARGCGMVIFNVLFMLLISFFTTIFSTIVACPLIYVSIVSVGVMVASSSGDNGAAGIALGIVLSQLGALWSITMVGSWLASTVYALQAFVLEQRSWTEAANRSLDLIFARFGHSLLMFMGAGAIFGTLLLSYLGSLLMLTTLIQNRLSLDLSPLAGDIIYIVITVASFVVLLPPLSIWMAMFHRRMANDRDGIDLGQRVTTWRAQVVGPSA